MGDLSFQNNVPDPLLAGKELPTFKFELEKSKGKVLGNSFGKEVTVEQLPISKGIAGVSMQLEPGVMRELHWHATAAEWAFVLKGRVRTTVINPAGQTETNDFEPGDIWYFPRGHAHVLECLGNEPTHFILIFDNGYFSEFGTFSITDWIGHAPKSLLAKNFGLPESAFDGFPSKEVYFARGAIPPEKIPENLQGPRVAPPQTHKFRMLSEAPHGVFKGGREWRVDSTRFPISTTSHRRNSRPRTWRTSRIALASQRRRMAIRNQGRCQRDHVWVARPFPERNSCTLETPDTSRRVTGIQSRTSAASGAEY